MRAAIPEKLEHPYPLLLSGFVSQGFGRGSKQLGVPTGMFSLRSQPAGRRGRARRSRAPNGNILWMGAGRFWPSVPHGDELWLESILQEHAQVGCSRN